VIIEKEDTRVFQ